MALILFFSANALIRLPIAGFLSHYRFKRAMSVIFRHPIPERRLVSA
jgi:hypothetical protein